MNSARTIAVLIALCMVAGCKHKTQTAPPPQAQAPILPPGNISQGMPPPEMPPPEAPKVNPPETDQAQQPPPKPHRTTRRKPKPADSTPAEGQTPAQTQATKETQQASAGEAPAASPIGQLSTPSDSGNTLTRRTVDEDITATENGLNGIKRQLSAEEQVTAMQIRTFLTKAKQARDQDDLDGANTLVTKARVLLTELTKP
jgi:outer membrane biosynthesis protein TonB